MFLIFYNFRWSFFSLIYGFWKFQNCILSQNSRIWWGLFNTSFWVEASLYIFLNFWNFRGYFLSLIFGFWKFQNWILNQNSHFWWGLFYKTFWFEASLYMFCFFGTLGGLFWVWFLVFENFKIVFLIRIPTFGGSVLWNFLIWGLLDDFIHSGGIIFLVQFWPPRGYWRHLQMILSYRGDRYGHLDTLHVKISPLFQVL